MSHFSRSLRPPRCFTNAEAQALLAASGRHAEHFRDHMIFAMAFGLGLRVHEIQALDMGDIYTPEGNVRRRVSLRVFKGCQRDGAGAPEVHIPETLVRKLAKLRALKERAGETLDSDGPLFSSRKKGRLSDRHMRRLLKKWLEAAGLDASLHFHTMRHGALTQFYNRTHDVVLTQRFARHADVRTTMRYLHSTDEAMAQALRNQIC